MQCKRHGKQKESKDLKDGNKGHRTGADDARAKKEVDHTVEI